MRAISSLIATVLMILITIAAVGVIVQAVMPMIKGNIEVANQCDSAKIEVSNEMGYTCYDPSVNIASISVSRGPENVAIDGIQIKLIDSNGQSKIAEVIQGGNYSFIDSTQMPEINSEKAFNINASVLNITNIERVSVIPIIKIGKTSKICSSSGTTELPKCSSAATFQQTVPPQQPGPSCNGLVSYWKLDDSSGSIALDSRGINNGTIVGANYLPNGKLGGAYRFNTSYSSMTSYIQAPVNNFPFGNTPRTISLWWNITGYNRFSYGDNMYLGYGSSNYVFTLMFGSGQGYRMSVQGGNANDIYSSPWIIGSSDFGQWQFIVMNYNGTAINQYRNGQYVWSANWNAPTATGGNMYIGTGAGSWQAGAFNGTIDELGVWNRTLNSTEILALYNNGNGIAYC